MPVKVMAAFGALPAMIDAWVLQLTRGRQDHLDVHGLREVAGAVEQRLADELSMCVAVSEPRARAARLLCLRGSYHYHLCTIATVGGVTIRISGCWRLASPGGWRRRSTRRLAGWCQRSHVRTQHGLGAPQAVPSVLSTSLKLLCSGDEFPDHAFRASSLSLVLSPARACAAWVGLAPDHRRWAVRARELPTARWAGSPRSFRTSGVSASRSPGYSRTPKKRPWERRARTRPGRRPGRDPCSCWPGRARSTCSTPRPRASRVRSERAPAAQLRDMPASA
jgi:hypothetical protein